MTNDVPGVADNAVLAVGHWAESKDGSLLLVEGVNEERVIYSVFNLSVNPPVEYRDAMPLDGFKETFSCSTSKKKGKNPLGGVWGWHDKTKFPWERVIDCGISDGIKYVSAEHQLNAALAVAKSRGLINEGKEVEPEQVKTFMETVGNKGRTVIDKIQRAIEELKS